ncbi:MAG: LysR family transcriptional regulator [Peptococcaceae bacterium]|nr:LysR family transcriptional regulator [Peptococcaceae bacterium]
MKTESLAYFLDLSQTRSLSQTAEHFYTSHQVISKSIKALENELNVKLIITNNQGTSLTEAGELLTRYAKTIATTLSDLTDALTPFVETQTSTCRINLLTSPYLTDSLILSFVADYQSHHPEIIVEHTSLPFSSALSQIDSGNSIFIIPTIEDATKEQYFVDALQKNNLLFTILAERPLYLCTYTKSPWASYDSIPADLLREIPMFLSSNITLNLNFNETPSHQFVTSIPAQKTLIRMGKGVGVFTQAEFDYYFRGEKQYLLIPAEMVPVQYICVRLRDTEIPDHVQTFLDEIQHCF